MKIVFATFTVVVLLGYSSFVGAPTITRSKTYIQATQSTDMAAIDGEKLLWLARVVSAEARGEPMKGKIAVANVVLNRMRHNRFPNTLLGVIFQEGQFCTVRNGTIYLEPTVGAKEAARRALGGEQVVGGDVVFFFNPRLTSRGNWIRTRVEAVRIGEHVFATTQPKTGR